VNVITVTVFLNCLNKLLRGAEAFEHQKLFLILSAVSALMALVFYIYRDEIYGWVKIIEGEGGITWTDEQQSLLEET